MAPDNARDRAHLKRNRANLVSVYGATAEVHDRITRTPGSFAAVMQGLCYLKEAGTAFTVQIVPMRDNFHQYEAMKELAKSLSPSFKVGASWLHLTACGSARRNAEIRRQRLEPEELFSFDPPDPGYEDQRAADERAARPLTPSDDRLLAACIASRQDFHVDPYGGMTFCCFIKDPALRYDLRKGSFREAWDSSYPAWPTKSGAPLSTGQTAEAASTVPTVTGATSMGT